MAKRKRITIQKDLIGRMGLYFVSPSNQKSKISRALLSAYRRSLKEERREIIFMDDTHVIALYAKEIKAYCKETDCRACPLAIKERDPDTNENYVTCSVCDDYPGGWDVDDLEV